MKQLVNEVGVRLYCKPCLARGKKMAAVKLVADEPWCRSCVKGDEKPEMELKFIPKGEIPISEKRSVMWQAVMGLKNNQGRDLAARIELIGCQKPGKVQAYLHEYAMRAGIKVVTQHINGTIYMELAPEKPRARA